MLSDVWTELGHGPQFVGHRLTWLISNSRATFSSSQANTATNLISSRFAPSSAQYFPPLDGLFASCTWLKKLMRSKISLHTSRWSKENKIPACLESSPHVIIDVYKNQNGVPLSFSKRFGKWIVVNLQLRHSWILVTGNCDELSLWKVEQPAIAMIHSQLGYNETQSIFLHGIQDNLRGKSDTYLEQQRQKSIRKLRSNTYTINYGIFWRMGRPWSLENHSKKIHLDLYTDQNFDGNPVGGKYNTLLVWQ